MILAFDTYYFDDKAKTVCIAFKSWSNEEPYTISSEILTDIAPYEPGEFYKRELPCILSLLKNFQPENIESIIVDGFVFLDDDGKPGLGAHLYNSLDKKIPVIGVAKTNFATLIHNKKALLRGASVKPLYITAIGMDADEAAGLIKEMRGEHRMPTLLKALDTLTKEIV